MASSSRSSKTKLKFRSLDRSSETPLHAQIERLLRQMIRRPEYRNGKLLPGEVELAKKLKVSRNTLRVAMVRLESEGLLQRTPKIGTRVVTAPRQTNFALWYSFTREMSQQGVELTRFEMTLRQTEPTADVAAALQISADQRIWQLRRVRGWDNCRVVLAISWLHPALKVKGNEDFSRPLYDILHEIAGIVPATSREEISAVAADRQLADALEVPPGHPILLRRRTIFDRKNNPVEYNLNYYRTDRHRLALDLRGPAK